MYGNTSLKNLKANARRADGGRFGYNLHTASGALFLFDFRTGETRRYTGAHADLLHLNLENTDTADLDYAIGVEPAYVGPSGSTSRLVSRFLAAHIYHVDAPSVGA